MKRALLTLAVFVTVALALWLCYKSYECGHTLGYSAGLEEGKKLVQHEAVNRGHARWDSGPLGQPIFTWNRHRRIIGGGSTTGDEAGATPPPTDE